MKHSLKLPQTYIKYYTIDIKQYAGHKFWGLRNFKQKEKPENMVNDVIKKFNK